MRLRVDEAFSLRRLTAKVIGEIESISTLTAAIASGMGVTVLPESAARSLCNAANGWMARITTPSMSLPLSLNVSAGEFIASGSGGERDPVVACR